MLILQDQHIGVGCSTWDEWPFWMACSVFSICLTCSSASVLSASILSLHSFMAISSVSSISTRFVRSENFCSAATYSTLVLHAMSLLRNCPPQTEGGGHHREGHLDGLKRDGSDSRHCLTCTASESQKVYSSSQSTTIAAESHSYGAGDVPHAALECTSRCSL